MVRGHAWRAVVASCLWWLVACGGSSYDPGETTAARCQDDQDNDGDGAPDCADPDCQGFTFCSEVSEDTALECRDGSDNDGNGRTDCADEGCQGFLFCAASTETTSTACQDGSDNDGDGDMDCADTDCQVFAFCDAGETSAANCQDGDDNDGDGDIDCADVDCQVFTFCTQNVETTAAQCRDAQDNDRDTLTDCGDPDCQGFTFCLPASETTSMLCRDQVDNDRDGQVDCLDADCAGFAFCLAGESTAEECQDGLDNDGDGSTDCEASSCWGWGFCQHYHGFPLVDRWGETWDGIERPALSFPEASATCEGLGGRLPTVTELHRNNATTGSGDLSDDRAVNTLWTFIANVQAGQHVSVRLSDGATAAYAEAQPLKFRCVWPDRAGEGFDADRCHGAPGDPCWSFGKVWNADRWDRTALDFAAAQNECAFYGASPSSAAEWSELIHAGLPAGAGNPMWVAGATAWYPNGWGLPFLRFVDATRAQWQYDGAQGGVSWAYDLRQFRCVGLALPADFPPPEPTCQGACFSVTARRSPLVADDSDRAPLPMAEAHEACRAAGGHLPNLEEASALVHAGWPNGTNAWLWLAEPGYWYNGNYGHPQFRFSGVGTPEWMFTTNFANLTTADTAQSFRCVFKTAGLTLPECPDGQVVSWTDDAYACAPGGPGTSGGNAHVIEIVDDWGNAWDGIQRDAATFADATAVCEGAGGRLPEANEVYAVRFTGNPHDPIGDSTSTSPLWTLTRPSPATSRVLVRISDGASSLASEATTNYFRCLWPGARSDVLERGSCYGPPGDDCFRLEGLVADRYDRVALDLAGAVNQCQAAGGRLPDLREATRLIHGGWSSGSDAWLWVNEAMCWYNNNYGYAVIRWAGIGLPEWRYLATSTGGLGVAADLRPFRCVYSIELR